MDNWMVYRVDMKVFLFSKHYKSYLTLDFIQKDPSPCPCMVLKSLQVQLTEVFCLCFSYFSFNV